MSVFHVLFGDLAERLSCCIHLTASSQCYRKYRSFAHLSVIEYSKVALVEETIQGENGGSACDTSGFADKIEEFSPSTKLRKGVLGGY